MVDYQVIKRDGKLEPFNLNKALTPCQDPRQREVLAMRLAEYIVDKMYSPIESSEIENLIAETAFDLEPVDLRYGLLAAATEALRMYNATEPTFSMAMDKACHLLNKDFRRLVDLHREALDDMIDPRRDAYLNYVSLRTLRRCYLLRDGPQLFERPQYMWLRVALQIYGSDIAAVKKTYDLTSTLRYTHASPTLFNSGTADPQLSSCFLMPAEEDPDDIFITLSRAARISRGGGGLGIGVQNIPAKGSRTYGIERTGLGPILKMFDAALDVIDQSVNKRPGAMMVYLEPWHADIFTFLRMKRVRQSSDMAAKRLFYGLFVNDLFMERVEQDGKWTLFCPSDAPELIETHGSEFRQYYLRLESQGRGDSIIRAREVWKAIIESQIESGGPSILFKDSINAKSNERHLGTITHANLCTEVVQYADQDETAVCNLASVVLPSFVTTDKAFDFDAFGEAVRHIVLSLNRVLVETTYPTSTTIESASRQCAIGIGVQGLADTFAMMEIPYDSEDAHELNIEIAEALYYHAMDESAELTRVFGVYPSFQGSPLSRGVLQFDYWDSPHFSGRFDWEALRAKVRRGVSNSLVVAYMPTAATSLITGYTEASEPYPGTMFNRKVLAGQFTITCRSLANQLQSLGLWTEEIRHQIMANEGSIQTIEAIPLRIREMYKTVWDIEAAVLVSMSAARAPFICQSQSLSLYFANPSVPSIDRALMHAWKVGLKTGLYYLRTKPASGALPIALPVDYWRHIVDDTDSQPSDALAGLRPPRGTRDDPICLGCSA